MRIKIGYSVFMQETNPDQRLRSELNYGNIINRLESTFEWISIPKNFHSSPVILKRKKEFPRADLLELVFEDWLYRVLIDSLKRDLSHVFILDSSLWLPASFEKSIQEIAISEHNPYEFISIWPTKNQSQNEIEEIEEKLVPTDDFSELGFLLNQTGIRKLLISLDRSPPCSFAQLIMNSGIKCASTSESSPSRPWVYVNLFKSQCSFRDEFKDHQFEQLSSQRETYIEQSTRKVSTQAFISHWYGTWDKVESIQKACRDFGFETVVINTTRISVNGWTNEIPISFFSQLEFACNSFEEVNDYLLFITADVKSDQWTKFFEYADQILRIIEPGTLTPTLSYEGLLLHRDRPPIFFDPGAPIAIKESSDLIVTFLHNSIVQDLQKFFRFFRNHPDTFNPKVGYGFVEILGSLTHYAGKVNLRDRRFVFQHSASKSYSNHEAMEERRLILEIANDYFLESQDEGLVSYSKLGSNRSHDHVVDQIYSLNFQMNSKG